MIPGVNSIIPFAVGERGPPTYVFLFYGNGTHYFYGGINVNNAKPQLFGTFIFIFSG